jgi:large subunit ribosomal protein L44e
LTDGSPLEDEEVLLQVLQETPDPQGRRSEERKVALGRRRYDRKQEGFVGHVKPLLHPSKKTSKKISLRFTCQAYKKSTMYCLGRLRKLEWANEKKKKHTEPSW